MQIFVLSDMLYVYHTVLGLPHFHTKVIMDDWLSICKARN
jgi:hypothetical protein